MLNQIPFEKLFRHILLISEGDSASSYDISKTSSTSMMKLFAFSTLLLQLFRDGLKTYSQARFKGVIKRISRLVRHTVHYVTDHWQNFAQFCQSPKGELAESDPAMIERLQVSFEGCCYSAIILLIYFYRCNMTSSLKML